MSKTNSTTDTKQKKPIKPAVMVGKVKLPVILDAEPKQRISVLWAGNLWAGTVEALEITDPDEADCVAFKIVMRDAKQTTV